MAFAQAARPIPGAVATLGVDARVEFIRKTYTHLVGAIVAFVVLEALFLQTELAIRWAAWALTGWNWLLVLGLFMVGGWVAQKWAFSGVSRKMQYLGLGAFILLEVLIMTPLLALAVFYAKDPLLIEKAGVITLAIFGGLTATVFVTKKDFSFLRGILGVGMFAAIGLILASILFGFTLGLVFTVAMIALMCGYILYHTSQILAHFPPTYHVGAALILFADIAMLFWYVLQLLWSLQGE